MDEALPSSPMIDHSRFRRDQGAPAYLIGAQNQNGQLFFAFHFTSSFPYFADRLELANFANREILECRSLSWKGRPMPTRNVNLTVELDRFVAKKVKTGRYENASEVVRAGLRTLERERATV